LRHTSKPDAQARISGPLALRERVRDLPPTGARGFCFFARARFQDVKEQAARNRFAAEGGYYSGRAVIIQTYGIRVNRARRYFARFSRVGWRVRFSSAEKRFGPGGRPDPRDPAIPGMRARSPRLALSPSSPKRGAGGEGFSSFLFVAAIRNYSRES
jgi:hypothetical protein